MILCSECYDVMACESFAGVRPCSTCERCGRVCLGYDTQLPPVSADEIYQTAVHDALIALGDDEPDDPGELRRRGAAAKEIMHAAIARIRSLDR